MSNHIGGSPSVVDLLSSESEPSVQSFPHAGEVVWNRPLERREVADLHHMDESLAAFRLPGLHIDVLPVVGGDKSVALYFRGHFEFLFGANRHSAMKVIYG